MRRRPRLLPLALGSWTGIALVAALAACNALLDNEERTLRRPAAGAEVEGGADGQAACDGGTCAPSVFYPQKNVRKIVVGGTRLYFVHTDKPPHWCDVAGCERGEGDVGTVPVRDLAVAVSGGNDAIFVADTDALLQYFPGSPKATTLAPIQKVLAVAVDSTSIYFATSLELYACDRATVCSNQQPQRIAPSGGTVTSIAVDESRVYWTTTVPNGMREVLKSARDAGSSTSLVDGTSSSTAVFDGKVYFAVSGASGGGSISRGDLTTKPRDVLVSGAGTLEGFAVENGGAKVYFAERTSGGTVFACDGKCAATSAQVVASRQGASAVAAMPSALYWSDLDAGVFKLAK